MKIKQLFLLIMLLGVAPQARPMMEDPGVATDITAISQAPWMNFDNALIFKDRPEIIINCFIAVLEKWHASAKAWEDTESAALHEKNLTTFLRTVISVLEKMLTIKNGGTNAGDFICVFDIDGTIYYAHPEDKKVIYQFLPTLMLYHAAVAVGCQIHIISARHQPDSESKHLFSSPYSRTIRNLSDHDIQVDTYTLHLNEGTDFLMHPIDERAAMMGAWKLEKRQSLAESNEILFAIDDLPECLKGDKACLGIGILVPVPALGAHYMTQKENDDAQICRLLEHRPPIDL